MIIRKAVTRKERLHVQSTHAVVRCTFRGLLHEEKCTSEQQRVRELRLQFLP